MSHASVKLTSNITFDDFKKLAQDSSLNTHEKIDFPSHYRQGMELKILSDIRHKLSNLNGRRKTILDIGAGCGELVRCIIRWCKKRQHQLILVDSAEMLQLIPDSVLITKIEGRFPDQCTKTLRRYEGRVDAVLCYSVLQYVHHEGSVGLFIDNAVKLLASNGELLIGDIPNVSKHNRFFKSKQGKRFHENFTHSRTPPPIDQKPNARGKLNDSILLSILKRYRGLGYDAYLVPQAANLPLANRREDILIKKS